MLLSQPKTVYDYQYVYTKFQYLVNIVNHWFCALLTLLKWRVLRKENLAAISHHIHINPMVEISGKLLMARRTSYIGTLMVLLTFRLPFPMFNGKFVIFSLDCRDSEFQFLLSPAIFHYPRDSGPTLTSNPANHVSSVHGPRRHRNL